MGRDSDRASDESEKSRKLKRRKFLFSGVVQNCPSPITRA